MKSVIFASVLATAAAFAPAQQKASTSALQVSELGTFSFFGVIYRLFPVPDKLNYLAHHDETDFSLNKSSSSSLYCFLS